MVSRPKLDGKVPVHASTYRNVGTSSKQRLVPLRSVTRAVSSNRIYSRTRIGFFSQIIFERESTLNGKRRTGTIRPTQSEGFRAEASGTHEEKTGNERKTLFALKGFSSEGGHQEARPDNADNQTKAWDVLGSGEEQNARNRMSADVADDVSKDQSAEQREGMQTKGNQEGWEEREAAWERMKVPKLTAVGTPYPSTWVRLFQIVRSQPMRVFHIVRAHPEEKEGGRTEQKREKRDAQKEKGDAQNEKADQQEKGRGEDLWKEGKGVEEKQGMGVSVMDISDERKKIRDKLEEEKGPEQQRRRDEQETGIGDERKSIGNEQQGTEPDEAAKQAVRVAGLEKDRQEERVEKRVRARKAGKDRISSRISGLPREVLSVQNLGVFLHVY